MAHGKSDAEIIRTTHNTARFFTETRQLAWVLLIGTVLWGVYGYLSMPQRKDPDIPVRIAVALCPWPGAGAERIEQLVTRKIEERMAENSKVDRIESVTRTGISVVYVKLIDELEDTGREFDDVKSRIESIGDLPDGAGPIQFIKDFGDTAALMLTVASPEPTALETEVRAWAVRRAVERARTRVVPEGGGTRMTIIYGFPQSVAAHMVRRHFELWASLAQDEGFVRGGVVMEGPGFVGLDCVSSKSDAELLTHGLRFIRERLRRSEIHPDVWSPAVIRDPAETAAKVSSSLGDKYTYRELDDFTDLIKRTLQTVPLVSKVTRSGILEEQVYLEYSQERLASYGIRTQSLPDFLAARNITLPGGTLEIEEKNLTIDPSGEFKSEKEIGDVLIPVSSGNRGHVYLRDVVSVSRAYESPPRYLNYYTRRGPDGEWLRTRAVTLSVQMRPGQKIGDFGAAVDAALADLRLRLPEDLVIARTSDQPLQVEENVSLFMSSLYEAIVLVVIVSLIGFWEWRSALLMALSIPITLAMTFGLMHVFGVDLQQVSIASLIIALGLLVDDPVVAGDAIKRDLAAGHPPLVAAWLGPTKLATAILFATITNIVAYLPFLLLSGDTGRFMKTLPIVIGSSLVASRIVSMTFIPLLGYYLLRPKAELPIHERRSRGFASIYYRVGSAAIQRRWAVLAGSLTILALGAFFAVRLRQEFFPKDLSYLSYADVWLPEDAPLSATRDAAELAEQVIRDVVDAYAREHGKGGAPVTHAAVGGAPGAGEVSKRDDRTDVLHSLTTFLGGGGPRFWFSVSPELSQLNYAQIIIQVEDKHDTGHLVSALQAAVSARVPGARIDVRQLETGGAVGIPISIRLSGDDIPTLRSYAEETAAIFRSIPEATRTRDNWGAESFAVKVIIDPDRASLSGVSNLDVAGASVAGMNGASVATLREGHKQIPVIARMRMEERSRLPDIQNLYVYSSQGTQKVPLQVISSLAYGMQTEKLQRRNQFRTITVSTFPESGVLASEVLAKAMPALKALGEKLPPGYRMEIGGEYEEQNKGFRNMAIVMGISVAMIFLTLVIQFRHAVKPFLVFAAIPYGMVGALGALWIMGSPFGFTAFLGIASLVGVIVSHVIVLFDFIEEAHERGEPLREALLDAGIMRLRPVMITVGATIIALIPLALHGGPLWEPLCYSQIGGLAAATFVTLLLVPVLYAIFVLDLKLVGWKAHEG